MEESTEQENMYMFELFDVSDLLDYACDLFSIFMHSYIDLYNRIM